MGASLDEDRDPRISAADLERKARRKAARAKRNATPEGKARRAAYDAKPESRARQAKYRAKPEVKARQAAYDAKCNATPEGKARQAAYNAERYATSEGKARQPFVNARDRARKIGVVNDLTLGQWLAALAYYGDTCAYCGAATTGLDHVIPLRVGGANSASNVVPCCPRCNKHKSQLALDTFIARNPHVAAYLGTGG